MPSNIAESLTNSRLDQVRIACDSGSANAAGAIVIRASDNTILADHDLDTPPSAANASGRTLTFNAIADVTIAADGTADHALLLDRDGGVICQLTVSVTGGGGEVQVGSLSYSTGNTSSITSAVLTEAAAA